MLSHWKGILITSKYITFMIDQPPLTVQLSPTGWEQRATADRCLYPGWWQAVPVCVLAHHQGQASADPTLEAVWCWFCPWCLPSPWPSQNCLCWRCSQATKSRWVLNGWLQELLESSLIISFLHTIFCNIKMLNQIIRNIHHSFGHWTELNSVAGLQTLFGVKGGCEVTFVFQCIYEAMWWEGRGDNVQVEGVKLEMIVDWKHSTLLESECYAFQLVFCLFSLLLNSGCLMLESSTPWKKRKWVFMIIYHFDNSTCNTCCHFTLFPVIFLFTNTDNLFTISVLHSEVYYW